MQFHPLEFHKEFSFLPKRSVFDKGGPEGQKGEEPPKKTAEQVATDAKEAAIKEALGKSGDVGDIKKDAETKVDATDAEQKIKDDAKKKLELHRAEFEQAKAYIGLRTTTRATLDQFKKMDATQQFENLDQLEKAKQELAKNKFAEEALKTELDAKIAEVQATAETYYNESTTKAGELVTTLLQGGGMEDISQAFSVLARLQGNKVSKYKGLPADKQSAMAKTTDASVASLLKAIEDAQGKLPDADKEKFKTLYGGALDLAKKADANFNNSREGDVGWKAGAEEYLAMSVAQSKAISARESIPRSDNFADNFYVSDPADLDKWNQEKWGPTVAAYKQALKDFDEAKKLTANTKAGDSSKAKELFDKARNGFLAVKAAAEGYAREKVDKEKGTADTAKSGAETAMNESQASWNKLPQGNTALLDYARKLGGGALKEAGGAWYDAVQLQEEGKKLYDEGKYTEAKAKYEESSKKFKESQKGYDEALQKYTDTTTHIQARITAGRDHHANVDSSASDATFETAVTNYLKETMSGMKPEELALIEGQSFPIQYTAGEVSKEVNVTINKSGDSYAPSFTLVHTFDQGNPDAGTSGGGGTGGAGGGDAGTPAPGGVPEA